jgi:hypothetical protein
MTLTPGWLGPRLGARNCLQIRLHKRFHTGDVFHGCVSIPLKCLPSLPCFVLLVQLIATAKILAVKVSTPVDLARLPCLGI